MPNEIYHRSNWGNANAEGFGDVYFDAAATNKLYNHSDYYENSWETDKTLKDLNNKASIVLTPTAYSDGSLNTVIPPYQVLPTELVTNGDFSDGLTGWNNNASFPVDYLSVVDDRLELENINGSTQVFTSDSFSVTANKIYKISLNTIKVSGADDFDITLRNTPLGITVETITTTQQTGELIYYFKSASTQSLVFQFTLRDTIKGTIDNVSVKEIQEADFDFSRGSSATRVNEQGLIENSQGDDYPRIDFTDGTGSLLLEPQTTNKFTYSEDFSQWNISDATITSSSFNAPDGTQNASILTTSASGGTVQDNLTVSNGNVTFSVFVKKGTTDGVRLRIDAATDSNGYFDLVNNTVYSSTNDAKIENYGNGWYRVSISDNITSFVKASIYTTDGTTSYDNGTLHIWGAQIEELSHPTSYIPTESDFVTRSADVANNSGNADLFNDSEGVLYAEIAALANDGTNRSISISDSTDANRIELRLATTDDRIQYNARTSSVTQASIFTDAYNVLDFNKIALLYKDNDFRLFVNGTQVATDTSGTAPTGLKELAFDLGDSSNDFYGKVRNVQVFTEALTDEQLEKLTS